jgi:putative copper resistance protein D
MGGKLVVIWLWVLLLAGSTLADDPPAMYQSSQDQQATHGAAHDHPGMAGDGWEGSAAGKAYSERNHHLAGVFVLLIGLSELRQGLALTILAWIRFLLPVSMLLAGGFLMVWSDHEAWPVGSLTFAQTFFGGDPEIFQHKLYGLMLLGVGTIELLRRTGRVRQALWMIPLPAFAIIGGLMLFLHSHGAHPAAQKIALNHAIMGIMAVSAGSSKLMSGWTGPCAVTAGAPSPSRWEIVWACFILLIGVQLLVYSE